MEDTSRAVLPIETQTIRTISKRIVPFLVLLFIMAFLDRTNIGFAALQMNKALSLSQTVFGLGAGIFFLGYFIAEVPSNILLHKFGARMWIARIMITWGIIAVLMGFIQNETHFLILRFILGIAEAGFFPGIIFYLSLWFPKRYRATVFASFYLGVPIAQVIGSPLSALLIQWGDSMGWEGWRVMFWIEGVPSIILGFVCLSYLTDYPSKATWLPADQKQWLENVLAKEDEEKIAELSKSDNKAMSLKEVLTNPIVWLLALAYFGITSGSNAMLFFLPSVIQSIKAAFGTELSIIQMGFITAIPYAFAAVGLVLWSRHSDRTLQRHKNCAIAAFMAAISITGALLINQPIAIFIGFILMAIGIFSAVIIFWTIPSEMLTGVGAAAGIGLINSVGNLSGFTGPYLTGYLHTVTGSYTAGFLVIAGFVAIGATSVLILWNLKNKSLRQRGES